MSLPSKDDGVNRQAHARPFLLTVGDPLVAMMPTRPIGLDQSAELAIFTGGAEINTAIGACRLGIDSAWLGRVGDDPLGRRVLSTLLDEGVDTSLAVVDPGAATGLYLREWLSDGLRRPYYYRNGSAGSRLAAGDWPATWPDHLPPPAIVHVTGITSALSEDADAAVHSMIDRAVQLGSAISVDPNYRLALWPDVGAARRTLTELVYRADVLLLSEEDAQLLFDSAEPARVFSALEPFELQQVVLKRGARGAIVLDQTGYFEVDVEPAAEVIDPVGAGDAFNAGFLAATLGGLSAADAAQCGAWCGARAVERLGENSGYPRRDELPEGLQLAFTVAASDRVSVDD